MASQLAPKLTYKQGMTRLNLTIQLFRKYHYPLSIKQIEIIEGELKRTKNFNTMNTTFKVLQTTFINEYNHQNNSIWKMHRIPLSTFFKIRFNKTLRNNVVGLNRRRTNIQWGKLIEKRLEARKILDGLREMLTRGRRTFFDKAVAVSYLYLSTIDGVYGRNLKDVVIWDKLSNLKNVNIDRIAKMNLTGANGIIDYFDSISNSKILFEGYNRNIRNAIAHSSFTVDTKTKTITYIDRTVKTKISYDNMVGNWQKLTNLDELVFFYNQIEVVNKVINDLK